jgi:hypothetical protein
MRLLIVLMMLIMLFLAAYNAAEHQWLLSFSSAVVTFNLGILFRVSGYVRRCTNKEARCK